MVLNLAAVQSDDVAKARYDQTITSANYLFFFSLSLCVSVVLNLAAVQSDDVAKARYDKIVNFLSPCVCVCVGLTVIVCEGQVFSLI